MVLWSIVSREEMEPAPEEDIERRKWRKRRDKAAGELYLAVLPEQRSHFGGAQDDPVAMWSALEAAHVKRRPGARFNAYNSLFSLRKGDDETLSSLASRVEESMRTVQNLRPKTFTLSELDDELQSMALIRALPDVYNAFIDALLLKDKLDKATIIDAFQNYEINRSEAATSSPSSSALCTSSPSSAHTPDAKCDFCGHLNHTMAQCFKFQKARKFAQQPRPERPNQRAN